MSKHTPGPWMADSHYPSVSAPTAPNLALCNDHAIPMSERLANARLIAAAPELLKALKYYSDTYCEGWCKEDGGTFEDCGGCQARAAIAKAEEA